MQNLFSELQNRVTKARLEMPSQQDGRQKNLKNDLEIQNFGKTYRMAI